MRIWVGLEILAIFLVGAALAVQDSLPEPAEEIFQQDVAWSPDGRWLAFSEYTGGAEYQRDEWHVSIQPLEGGEKTRLASQARYVTWSPDGTRLAFGAEREGNWDVYTIGRDGSGLQRLTTNEATDGQPAFSPDGQRIAFASERDGNREIYTMAADGSRHRRLTDDPADDYNPDWSPDGRWLVFYREKGDGMDQIHVVAADGSSERAITADQRHNVFPTFHPDGRIAFMSGEKDSREEDLVLVEPDGSGRQAVDHVPGFTARFSPDGKWIAFIDGPGWPTSAVYVVAAGGGEVRKVVN